MSIIRAIRAQLGLSGTASQNFTLDASAADGSMKLARGNAGATTQDIMTVSAAGKVQFPAGSDMIGVGQTWQDVKASRAVGTTYTNTTGRPIQVSVTCSVNTGVVNTLSVDGLPVAYSSVGVIGNGLTLQAIVPAGSTYVLTNTGGTTVLYWVELR